MVSALVFSLLVLMALVWLCVLLHWLWSSDQCHLLHPARRPPYAQVPPRAPTLYGSHPQAALRRVCTCPSPLAHRRPAPRHPGIVMTRGRRRQVDTAHPVLSQPGLCVSGLGLLGRPPRQWPSEWRSLAPTAVCRLSPLFS